MLLRGTLYSNILQIDTGISVLTPKSIQAKNYQVVYLLHGLGGNHESWLSHTMLPVYAEKYNMIFVMPEVARSFYSDMRHGHPYFTYLAEELPKLIKATFNVSAQKEDTYVVGASMGGYGALKLALTYPEVFGNVLAFSAAALFMRKELQKMTERSEVSEGQAKLTDSLIGDFISAFGQELNYFSEEVDLVTLAQGFGEQSRPNLYLSCGLNDSFLDDNRRFAEILGDTGWKLIYREFVGGHDWYHFNEALIKGLRWTRKKK